VPAKVRALPREYKEMRRHKSHGKCLTVFGSSSFTRHSRATLRMEIVTHRDIQEGEEITVSCKFQSSVKWGNTAPTQRVSN